MQKRNKLFKAVSVLSAFLLVCILAEPIVTVKAMTPHNIVVFKDYGSNIYSICISIISFERLGDNLENRYIKFFLYDFSYKIFQNPRTVHKIVSTFHPLGAEPQVADLQTRIVYYKMLIDHPDNYKIINYDVLYDKMYQSDDILFYMFTLYYSGKKELFRNEYEKYYNRFDGLQHGLVYIILSPECKSTKSDYLWAIKKIELIKYTYFDRDGMIKELNDALSKID